MGKLGLADYPELPLECGDLLLIVGGGAVDEGQLRAVAKLANTVVAADGGADVCRRLNVMPNAIIGDLDSLTDVSDWPIETPVFRLDEQETTDFEKCLYATRSKVVVAVGMTGGRLDHSLAALDIVARFATERNVILLDQEDVAYATTGTFAMNIEVGARVSIFPLAPVQFERSVGLKYPLDGIKLEIGARVGTSNVTCGSWFEVIPNPAQTAPYLVILAQEKWSDLSRLLLQAVN